MGADEFGFMWKEGERHERNKHAVDTRGGWAQGGALPFDPLGSVNRVFVVLDLPAKRCADLSEPRKKEGISGRKIPDQKTTTFWSDFLG